MENKKNTETPTTGTQAKEDFPPVGATPTNTSNSKKSNSKGPSKKKKSKKGSKTISVGKIDGAGKLFTTISMF